MAIIRYFSPAPGQGAHATGFLSAMFGDLEGLRLSSTEMRIIGGEVRTSWIGSNLTYFYGEGSTIPLPIPVSGQLDQLVMRVKENNKIIWSIDDWNMTGKKMQQAFKADDMLEVYNVFFGADDKIFGTGQQDLLWGGDGDDVIRAGGGGDSLVGHVGNDRIFGQAGGDTVAADNGKDQVFGGSGADFADGGIGNDSLYGGGGNDVLSGGAGLDLIVGGAGGDLMTGGTGADRFLFNTAAIDGVVDNIGDFNTSADSILLDNDAFAALGMAGTLRAGQFRLGSDATTANHRVLYDPASGNLWYDRDGSGGAAKVLIAILDDGLAMTRDHFQIVD
jgi:Ca2+-binding RTX toxin-like protein